MTTAPPSLLGARTLLLTYLNPAPAARAADLEPDEVGIVGDTAHVASGDSYHLGLPEQRKTGYSVTESPRDKAGLTTYASALDVGEFELRVGGKTHNLRTFSIWCVAQCKAGKPDAADIREIIYSADGRTVRRWDRLGKRSTGDSSHLWHTHFSFFRDATKDGRDQRPLFRRYLTEIGLIASPAAPIPTPAPATKRRKRMELLLIKAPAPDPTVWLSWGPDRGRVPLSDWGKQADPLIKAGVPYIEAKTTAELTLLGGPARTTAS